MAQLLATLQRSFRGGRVFLSKARGPEHDVGDYHARVGTQLLGASLAQVRSLRRLIKLATLEVEARLGDVHIDSRDLIALTGEGSRARNRLGGCIEVAEARLGQGEEIGHHRYRDRISGLHDDVERIAHLALSLAKLPGKRRI